MTASAPAASAANGITQAERSNQLSVFGVESTFGPYLSENDARMTLSLLPSLMYCLSSLRIGGADEQLIISQPERSWLQLHMQIRPWPSVSARSSLACMLD